VTRRRSQPRLRDVALMLTLAMLPACGLVAPRPQKTDFLQTAGGGFLYDRDKQQVQYAIVVAPRKPLPEGSILEATFEDPVGERPYVVSVVVKQGVMDYTLNSPPVHGTRAGATYHVQIKLYADAGKSQLLDSYAQGVRASVDQGTLGWP
jgi:hypothetical protein